MHRLKLSFKNVNFSLIYQLFVSEKLCENDLFWLTAHHLSLYETVLFLVRSQLIYDQVWGIHLGCQSHSRGCLFSKSCYLANLSRSLFLPLYNSQIVSTATFKVMYKDLGSREFNELNWLPMHVL